MKLSAAIESVLLANLYAPFDGISHKHSFMCNAIDFLGTNRAVSRQVRREWAYAIQSMLDSLGYGSGECLVIILTKHLGKPVTNKTESDFDYLRQFWVWCVFDLKRKGL